MDLPAAGQIPNNSFHMLKHLSEWVWNDSLRKTYVGFVTSDKINFFEGNIKYSFIALCSLIIWRPRMHSIDIKVFPGAYFLYGCCHLASVCSHIYLTNLLCNLLQYS